MLIYDQALDPYHSAIRILAIVMAATKQQIELAIDGARIADYFLVYPNKMINFKFPAEFSSLRVAVKQTANPYRPALGRRVAFERMQPIFFAALSGLVAANLINVANLKRGILSFNEAAIPDDLLAAVIGFWERQTEVGRFVLADFLTIRTTGKNGLKHRSNLMEHRYDVA